MRKPDAQIYLYALNNLGVKPEEAVFVDDRLVNVEGARKVGMGTVLFQNPAQCKKELDKLLGFAEN